MRQRMDRIGELLAKGVFLYLENEKNVKNRKANVDKDKISLPSGCDNIKKQSDA